MVMPKVKYEEIRQQRMEENKKKLEQLHLPLLSQALQKASSPKPSPMKKAKPRTIRTELVAVRRSGRFTNQPAPVYKEVIYYERVQLPRRYRKLLFTLRKWCIRKGICPIGSMPRMNQGHGKAEKLESTLEGDHPTFIKPMLQSHVTGGFWLDLPSHFCKRNLPKRDDTVTLVDEQGDEWPTVYLARKTGLSGGWKKFSIDHDLVDGDALVFQLVQPSIFKVYIIRVNGYAEDNVLEGSNV